MTPLRILVDHRGEKGLGDIVCETGFYRALRERHPEAWIASRGSRTLAWGHPLVDSFDETSPDEAFDLIVATPDLKPVTATLRDALAEGLSVFDNFRRFHGLPADPTPPSLYVLPREMEELGLEDDGGDELIVAFSVDSKEPDRRWGEERFRALMAHMETAHGVSLIELGGGLSAGHLGLGYDLVGQTTLRQTMAVLSLADLFVGNHGGLTHLSGALGTPILSPWGASHPYAAYAYDADSIAVEVSPACRNCGWSGNVLSECRAANLQKGRTPCTQAISVERMIAEADALVPRLRARRTALREAKALMREAARDPRGLSRFETDHAITPFTHQHLYLGGEPGWGREHREDNFARLRTRVAFPDWLGPLATWKQEVAAFVADHEATAPWALTLTAHPLTGPEVSQVLDDFIRRELKPGKVVPKIKVILGSISPEERESLIRHADEAPSYGT
ncbi:MAG TPA: glycosyltransferase family 9 protein [Pantanalinema sp.]